MNIRVDMNTPIKDGTEVVFRSPVDCSQVTGLIVYYKDGGNTGSQEFAFADAHGNNVGDIDHLFAENVVVKVILDVTTSMAFVQNADTNAYLEGRFQKLEGMIGSGGGGGGVNPELVEQYVDEYLAENPPAPGEPGKDGTVVTVTTSEVTSPRRGTTVVINTQDPDSNSGNMTIFTVYDGNNGANGKTPVRGTDYWTEEDKQEIKSYVEEAILGGAW